MAQLSAKMKRSLGQPDPEEQKDAYNVKKSQVEKVKINFKEKWDKRKYEERIQPYAEHIELFLGLINSVYAKEIIDVIADTELNHNDERNFYVEDSSTPFHWQLVDDRKERTKQGPIANPFAMRKYFGSIAEHYNTLNHANRKGAGIFVAINEIEGSQRVNTAVTAARAVWIEDDKKRTSFRTATSTKDPLPLPPSLVVETSTGKYHYYWLTYTDDLRRWERIQKEVMVEHYDSDPGANGKNRAMRVPGFFHNKTQAFSTRIVYLLGDDGIPIEPIPSEQFKYIKDQKIKCDESYAFNVKDINKVKRYDWEEIEEAFGIFLGEESISTVEVSSFDPVDAIQNVLVTEDFHGSLHALCMHFANYQQDAQYVKAVVEGLMCRVPESLRDERWKSRFIDIERSAVAAVNKKLEELTQETLLSKTEIPEIKEEISFHDDDWILPFDYKTGVEPFDQIVEHFGSMTGSPIYSFNFATALSFAALILQNIPLMPVKASRYANGCHLLLASSTDGKDMNTTSPLKSLISALRHRSQLKYATNMNIAEVLNGAEPSNGEITSLSAYHNWANLRPCGAIWTNTECTSVIGKMSDENANVSNLAEVVVRIQDGEDIPIITKASKKDNNINQPLNTSQVILFATQPASIKKYMTADLLYKGVIGRFDYYIPDRAINDGNYVSYISKQSIKIIQWPDELLDFLLWAINVCTEKAHSENIIKTKNTPVVFENNDVDPIRYPDKLNEIDGPRRQKFIQWDEQCANNPELTMEDPQFRTFTARIQMSVERVMTILASIEYLWQHYKRKAVPFHDVIVIPDHVLDYGLKYGDYQYQVRTKRIWPLIGSGKGLDEQHQATLDALKRADKNPNLWIKYETAARRAIFDELFGSERFVPVSGVIKCLAKDAMIPTNRIINILETLSAMNLVEFHRSKAIKATLSAKPIKNVVRLTQLGRS